MTPINLIPYTQSGEPGQQHELRELRLSCFLRGGGFLRGAGFRVKGVGLGFGASVFRSQGFVFRSEDSRFRGGLRTTDVSGLLPAPKQLDEPSWEGSYLEGEGDLVRIFLFWKGLEGLEAA